MDSYRYQPLAKRTQLLLAIPILCIPLMGLECSDKKSASVKFWYNVSGMLEVDDSVTPQIGDDEVQINLECGYIGIYGHWAHTHTRQYWFTNGEGEETADFGGRRDDVDWCVVTLRSIPASHTCQLSTAYDESQWQDKDWFAEMPPGEWLRESNWEDNILTVTCLYTPTSPEAPPIAPPISIPDFQLTTEQKVITSLTPYELASEPYKGAGPLLSYVEYFVPNMSNIVKYHVLDNTTPCTSVNTNTAGHRIYTLTNCIDTYGFVHNGTFVVDPSCTDIDAKLLLSNPSTCLWDAMSYDLTQKEGDFLREFKGAVTVQKSAETDNTYNIHFSSADSYIGSTEAFFNAVVCGMSWTKVFTLPAHETVMGGCKRSQVNTLDTGVESLRLGAVLCTLDNAHNYLCPLDSHTYVSPRELYNTLSNTNAKLCDDGVLWGQSGTFSVEGTTTRTIVFDECAGTASEDDVPITGGVDYYFGLIATALKDFKIK